MAAVLSYFELQLSEDVVRDIKTEGKMFKVDLMDVHQSSEDLAGIDYTKSALTAAEAGTEAGKKSPAPRIQLEKLNDRFIKLFITVYKSSVESATTESEMQTTEVESCQMSSQTDSSQWMRAGDTQTNGSDWSHVIGIQTDHTEWQHCEATQTVPGMGSDIICTQTDWQDWLCCASVQTDCSYWQSTVSAQTDVKQLSSTSAQTKEMRIEQEFSDVATETQANLATQVNEQVQAAVVMNTAQIQTSVETVDFQCQSAPGVVDRNMQTECDDKEIETQTELSTAWRADRESQAVVTVAESGMQTAVSVNVVDCQTDSSMAKMLCRDVQAAADVTSSDSQTDVDVCCSETQTDMTGEAQTSVTPSESLSHVDDIPAESSLLATQDSVANESFDDFGGNITLSQDTSFQQPVDHGLTSDASAQTDPVTIIIGDASFLVKKLKNSAGSPSRVTTTGNEIEIELSADAVTEGGSTDYQTPIGLPQSDEKENEMMRQQMAMMQQPQAVVRSGGVMCRGGSAVSGPRFRMPVSASPPARLSSGLLVRHPVQQQQAVPGPQPVIGGSFSCPFCSLTFIDSPALYEHLSILHTVDQKTKWKQPRGREGKTIIPVKSPGRSPGLPQQLELGPPVLAPVEALRTSGSGNVSTVQQGDTGDTGSQEAALFEDPVELEVSKKHRGRPPRADVEETEMPSKKQKLMEEDEEEEADVVSKSKSRASAGDAGANTKQPSPAGRRGGRSARGRRS